MGFATSGWRMMAGVALTGAVLSGAARGDILITEIMYDNAGGNEHEYVELHNNGPATVDLTGYVLEDSTGAQSTISAGSIAAGGITVLIRVDATRTHANYENAWGAAINWIDMTGWPTYTNNPGDSVILKDAGANVVAQVDYEAGANGWPAPNDSASIYLLDLNGPQNAASNWALSQDGVDGAHFGNSPRASDLGSPGFVVVPEPASLALACLSTLMLLNRRR